MSPTPTAVPPHGCRCWGELRHGIDRGELELHYLPKVFLADGWTGGMEALVRWRHLRLGMIMPADFIPAAEQSCLMRDLTACVVDAVLARLFDGPDTRLIVKSLVDLVRALSIRSVAEGVEPPDAAGALAAIGFDAA